MNCPNAVVLATLALLQMPLLLHAAFPSGSNSFASASVIPPLQDYSDYESSNTNLLSYTIEPGEPAHGADGDSEEDTDSHSAWWQWTPEESGFCTLDTSASVKFTEAAYETVIAVYTGTNLDSLTRVAKGESEPYSVAFGLPVLSKVTFYAEAGTTYFIAVDGAFDGAIGIGSVNVVLTLRQVPAVARTMRGAWLAERGTTDRQGMIQLTLTAAGSYSGFLNVGSKKYSFKGRLDEDGTSTFSVTRPTPKGRLPVPPITVKFDAATDHYLLTLDSTTVRDLTYRVVKFTPDRPNPVHGVYNQSFSIDRIAARGWMRSTISKSGAVKCAGVMPDGVPITFSSPLCQSKISSTEFYLPVHVSLYKGAGWLNVTGGIDGSQDTESQQLSFRGGKIYRPANLKVKGAAYSAGIDDDEVDIEGGRFEKPAPGQRVLGFLDTTGGTGLLFISSSTDNIFVPDFSTSVSLDSKNKFAFPAPNADKNALKLNASTGLVTGTVTVEQLQGEETVLVKRALKAIILRMSGGNVALMGHAEGAETNDYFGISAIIGGDS
jgi:hypothetical protein